MNSMQNSFNKTLFLFFSLFVVISGCMLTLLYLLTNNIIVFWIGLSYSLFSILIFILLITLVRRNILNFSNNLCQLLDQMINQDYDQINFTLFTEDESLFNKIYQRLIRLFEVMQDNRNVINKERIELQELISDISHQVKTPISNLKMIISTILEKPMSEKKQKEFLFACEGQLDKLNFLMQSMIKTSRLESGIFSIEKKKQSIYETIAIALGESLLKAEQKNISIEVVCDEKLEVFHDRKWTNEALFNLIENAVKYTNPNGCIQISVEPWEIYLKIDIKDNGKGIPEKYQAEIFKRFYRENEVHEIEGIGIGLYLSRKIITMQGGFITVSSEVGKGSTFSVFLPYI